jgi:aryl-alcohol dehydrogenase-like predicted oxidoreductase
MPTPPALPQRSLGGLQVSAQGFGCLATTDFYGSPDRRTAVRTVHAAIDAGVTLLDTADVQGLGAGEELLGRAVAGRRDQVLLATKFGMVRSPDGAFQGLCGDPGYVRTACEASLRRLRVDCVDLYYQHWIDPAVPPEETAGAVGELIRQGKVRRFGLSEPSAATIRRAHAEQPVTAVQSEWSLWCREPAESVLGVCRELGIGFVAYAPLGRGFLTGAVQETDSLAADDFRRGLPRFSPGNLPGNLALPRALRPVADRLGLTLAQLALAWLHHQGADVVPIPSTGNPDHLAENLAAAHAVLHADDLRAIEAAASVAILGDRYPAPMLAMTGT